MVENNIYVDKKLLYFDFLAVDTEKWVKLVLKMSWM